MSRCCIMTALKREVPIQTYEIYQLKSGDEMRDIRLMPYEFIA